MRKFGLMMVAVLLAGSIGLTDYNTGFETLDGFTAGSNLAGCDGWADYIGYGRGTATDAATPGPEVGSQYARIYGGNFNASSSAGYNRLLDATERIGDGRENAWTASASLWMTTASNDSAFGFGGAYLSDSDSGDAVVAGFNGDNFAYYNGTTLVTSSYTFTANAWYLFEFELNCGGTGVNDTYDIRVSDTNGVEVFSVADLYFRASGNVDYIDNIKLFSSRANANVAGWDATGSMYYDEVNLVPEPATMTLLVIGSGLLVHYRRRNK